LNAVSFDNVSARCGCPAGKGPHAAVSTWLPSVMLYRSFAVSKTNLPDFLTCTDQLQEWNRSWPKKLDIADFSSRRHETLKRKQRKTHQAPTVMILDHQNIAEFGSCGEASL